jgi:propanol-preferring alcohol dehydrogenase
MCEYCIKGRENLCNSIKITGENLNGGYAEYISISEDFVTIIPDKLDFEHAASLFRPGKLPNLLLPNLLAYLEQVG